MGEHQLDKLGVTGSSPVPPIQTRVAEPIWLGCAGQPYQRGHESSSGAYRGAASEVGDELRARNYVGASDVLPRD